MQRGKFVILVIFAVAIALSGYAWWYQFRMGRRSAAFWEPAGAVLVRYAPQVEFVPLQPTRADQQSSDNAVTISNVELWPGEPVNITNTRGMVHVRHALVDDMSFDWNATAAKVNQWEFLLRFRDGEQHVTAAIDTESGQVCFVEGARIARLVPQIATAIRQKREEWQKLPSAKP